MEESTAFTQYITVTGNDAFMDDWWSPGTPFFQATLLLPPNPAFRKVSKNEIISYKRRSWLLEAN